MKLVTSGCGSRGFTMWLDRPALRLKRRNGFVFLPALILLLVGSCTSRQVGPRPRTTLAAPAATEPSTHFRVLRGKSVSCGDIPVPGEIQHEYHVGVCFVVDLGDFRNDFYAGGSQPGNRRIGVLFAGVAEHPYSIR